MEDAYLVDLNNQIYKEVKRCKIICDIYLLEEKIRNHENNLIRYYYALKMLFLIKAADIDISLEHSELWNLEIERQLKETTKNIDTLYALRDSYTNKKVL